MFVLEYVNAPRAYRTYQLTVWQKKLCIYALYRMLTASYLENTTALYTCLTISVQDNLGEPVSLLLQQTWSGWRCDNWKKKHLHHVNTRSCLATQLTVSKRGKAAIILEYARHKHKRERRQALQDHNNNVQIKTQTQ